MGRGNVEDFKETRKAEFVYILRILLKRYGAPSNFNSLTLTGLHLRTYAGAYELSLGPGSAGVEADHLGQRGKLCGSAC